MVDLNTWLREHPEWILGADLRAHIDDEENIRRIFSQIEHGFVTRGGEYFKSLKEVPSFVGIREVVKYKIQSKFDQ